MSALWRFIKSLFTFAWRLLAFVRDLTFNLVFLFIVLLGLGIYAGMNKNTVAPQDGILLVNISGTLVDESRDDNLLKQIGNDLLGNNSPQSRENSLFNVVDLIRQAKDDPKITGIVLSLENFVGGDKPALDYVGKALQEFRESKKPIYAMGNYYTQSQYYLASFADKVYLAPQGSVNITGLATNNFYFRSLLNSIHAKTYVYRVGTYKSAVEPYILDAMSEESRQSTELWLNTMWSTFATQIAQNRQIKIENVLPDLKTLHEQLKQVSGDSSAYAMQNKFVDELLSYPQFEEMLTKEYGSRDDTYTRVSIYDYQLAPVIDKADKIGVIFVNGAITDGPKNSGVAGADSIVEQLRQARNDKAVKAVILRVNSPGGSVTASELIRSEIVALRNANKPVVVSMGGMAASGGYWISTPANYIIASPSTLTGSIGIFGLITTFEQTLSTLGVYTDGVETSPLAGLTLTKDIPDEVSDIIQLQIEHGYRTFIGLVATARHKTPEQIDKIAQGRVWIGSDAKANGLVDQLGDFDTAVAKAAELAKITDADYQLTWFTPELSLSEVLFGQLNASVQAMVPNAIKAALPTPLTKTLTEISQQQSIFEQIQDPQHRYIYCLSCSYTN